MWHCRAVACSQIGKNPYWIGVPISRTFVVGACDRQISTQSGSWFAPCVKCNMVIKADVIRNNHASNLEPSKIKSSLINNRNFGNACF